MADQPAIWAHRASSATNSIMASSAVYSISSENLSQSQDSSLARKLSSKYISSGCNKGVAHTSRSQDSHGPLCTAVLRLMRPAKAIIVEKETILKEKSIRSQGLTRNAKVRE